jgi:hypothetical protein
MRNFHIFVEERDVAKLAQDQGIDIKGICLKQLRMGYQVEKEHDGRMGKDTDVVRSAVSPLKIAVAHLREKPNYYTLLKKVEGD